MIERSGLAPELNLSGEMDENRQLCRIINASITTSKTRLKRNKRKPKKQ